MIISNKTVLIIIKKFKKLFLVSELDGTQII